METCGCVFVWLCFCVELRVCFPDLIQQYSTGACRGSRLLHIFFNLLTQAFHIRIMCGLMFQSMDGWMMFNMRVCALLPHVYILYSSMCVCICTLFNSCALGMVPGDEWNTTSKAVFFFFKLKISSSSCI